VEIFIGRGLRQQRKSQQESPEQHSRRLCHSDTPIGAGSRIGPVLELGT
jgi:hypothetical protein